MRRLLTVVAAATLATGTLVTAAASSSAAVKPTILGTLKSGSTPVSGVRVLLLTKGGQAIVSSTNASGKFSLKVAANRVAGSTLQLVSSNDRYIGPVTLATDAISATRGAAHMQFSGQVPSSGTLDLGILAYKSAADSHPIGAVASRAKCTTAGAANCWYFQAPAAFFNPKNDQDRSLPAAAKKYGLTAKSPPKVTKTEISALTGMVNANLKAPRRPALQGGGGTTVDVNTEPGADQDSDGIPNALDVDDNGNASLDSVDTKSSTSASALLNPVTSIHLQYGSTRYQGLDGAVGGAQTDNVELNGSLTASDVSAKLGDQAGTSVAYDQSTLLSAVGAGSSDSIDWARVDCGALTYCGADSPTAKFVQMGYAGGSGDGSGSLWSSVGGYRWEGMGATCPQAAVSGNYGYLPDSWTSDPANAGKAKNALSLLCRSDGGLKEIWYAGFYSEATSGAGFTSFLPGDVYELQVHIVNGELRTMPISLSPYYATVPGIKTVNGVTLDPSTADSYVAQLGSDGLLTIEFYRPQRLVVPGETGVNGFMDQAGLHFGVSIGNASSYSPAFCGGYYSNLSSNLTNTIAAGDHNQPANGPKNYLYSWSLADSSTVDDAPDAANSAHLYRFTVDLKSCLNNDHTYWHDQNNGGYIPTWSELAGQKISIGLGAMGAELAQYQMNQASTIFYAQVPS